MTDKKSEMRQIVAALDPDVRSIAAALEALDMDGVAGFVRRQQAEIETLRAGYDATRLEIESLQSQLHAAKQINAAQFTLLAASIPGSVPQGKGWVVLPGQLPEPGKPVLLDIGKTYPIRAMWAAKHTVQAADDDTDWGEYVEADDMYYAPEGWYEWNECEDNHWRVSETPRAWRELPTTIPAVPGPAGGESNG